MIIILELSKSSGKKDNTTRTQGSEEEHRIETSLVEDGTQGSNIKSNIMNHSNQPGKDDFGQQTLKPQDISRKPCWYNSANKIDRSAIVFSPIVFSVIISIYWISYLSRYIIG